MAGGNGDVERSRGNEPGRTPGGGWVPVPDPTALTTEAVTRVTTQFQRELVALRELHDKDLVAARELLDARLAASEQDRKRLWERARELTAEFDVTLTRFRDEVERRDAANRQLVEQRLEDLDKARILAADQIKAMPALEREHRERLCSDFHHSRAAEREYLLAQLEITATRMTERFEAVNEQFSASKTAVDAALTAQKEAVSEQNKANDRAIAKSETATKEQLTSLGQVADASFKAMEDKITDARDRLTGIESLTRGIKEASGEDRADRGLQHGSVQLALFSVSLLLSLVAVIITIVLHK